MNSKHARVAGVDRYVYTLHLIYMRRISSAKRPNAF